jgi:undecaprenyl phosphate-alpha-L-ara4N flippase subunit ArnE
MTPLNFILILLTECLAVVGNLLFKHAMNQSERSRTIRFLVMGIAMLALNFFLWLGLLPKFPLSYLYPFDGLTRLMVVVGAIVLLKEKVTPPLWGGMLLITAGIALVSAS